MPTIMLPTDPALFKPSSTKIVFPEETLDERVEKLEKNSLENMAAVKSSLNDLAAQLKATNEQVRKGAPEVQNQLNKLARQIRKVAVLADTTHQKVIKITPIHQKQLERLTISLKRLALDYESTYEKQRKELAALEKALDLAKANSKGNLEQLKKVINLNAEVHDRIFRSLDTKVTQTQLESVVEQINAIFKMLPSQTDSKCCPASANATESQSEKGEDKGTESPKDNEPVPGEDVISAPILPDFNEQVAIKD